jgi:8-oxo-dGTP pyrophosphatase MutT (NUDIX family)
MIGHVDPGEDVLQTAARETEEESGLSSNHYDVIKEFHIILEVFGLCVMIYLLSGIIRIRNSLIMLCTFSVHCERKGETSGLLACLP